MGRTDCCNIYVPEIWVLSSFNTGKQKHNEKERNEKRLPLDE